MFAPMLHTLATIPPLRFSHESDAAVGEGLEGLFFRTRGVVDGAAEVDALFMMIFWFSVFFFVLLMALMFYWGFFKYRRRPGVPAPRSASHNGPLEIIWTVVPSSALLVIFFLGLWTYIDRQVATGNAINLNVTAWKWGWGVDYPNGAQSQWAVPLDPGTTQNVPIFVVPEDNNISLRMISNDVIHSFWIPDFRVKMDVFPNRYTGYAFETPTLAEGEPYRDHWIFCAEYCGDLHSEMAAVLRVVPWGEYVKITQETWALGDLSPVEIGQRVYASKCATCHSVDGSANTGPTWLNAYGYEVPLADGQTVIGDANYMRESILYPGRKIHRGYANQMPPFDGLLSEEQINGVIDYMRSLSDRGGVGEPPAEGEPESPVGAPIDNEPGNPDATPEADPAAEPPAQGEQAAEESQN